MPSVLDAPLNRVSPDCDACSATFDPFALAPDVEVVKTLLPDSIGGRLPERHLFRCRPRPRSGKAPGETLLDDLHDDRRIADFWFG